MEKTVGGPDEHGSSPLRRGEGGTESSKFFSLGKTQRVFESPPKPLTMNHGNRNASIRMVLKSKREENEDIYHPLFHPKR